MCIDMCRIACHSFLFALSVGVSNANAESVEFLPSLQMQGFADTPVQGEISSDTRFSGHIDALLTINNIWQGGTMKAQLQYAGGDSTIGLGKAGVTWPTNTYTAMPRVVNSNEAEWSLWFTQKFNENHSLSVFKWNVFELAEHNPLVGGQGKGGFQYLGINTPISFVFPPYFLGAQYAYTTEKINYSLFVYDTNTTAGDGYWDDLFDDGAIFNGTATYKADFGGLAGFYSLNLVWSTQNGTDFKSIPPELDPENPAENALDYTSGEGFATIKFQQFLSNGTGEATNGWGVFGQIGFGSDANPLDVLLLLGLGILLGTLVPLFVVPFFALFMNATFIPVEEKKMAETFGKKWEEYCRSVRRWA